MTSYRTMRTQKGYVLLEALIAILLFSVGILALVGMQATAINNVSDSKYRTEAGFLADQIIGVIWGNRVVVPGVSGVAADPSFSCNPCNASTGNAYTQQWWASGVNATLPQASAVIAVNAGRVEVIISWQPPKAATAHTHSVVAYVD